LFRTCRTSSFCTVAWQLARFQLTRRIARSLGDSWASCYEPPLWHVYDESFTQCFLPATCTPLTFHFTCRGVGLGGHHLSRYSQSVCCSPLPQFHQVGCLRAASYIDDNNWEFCMVKSVHVLFIIINGVLGRIAMHCIRCGLLLHM